MGLNSRWFAPAIALSVGAGSLIGCTAGARFEKESREAQEVVLFPIHTPSGTGFIDTSGQTVIEPVFQGLPHMNFREGLCAVTENGKWGFINTRGEYAVEPVFEKTGYWFMDGICSVLIDGKWGFIDTAGQVVIQAQYDRVGFFREGIASVSKNGLWGFVDREGKMVIEPQFQDGTFAGNPPHFQGGLLQLYKPDRYVDIQGNVVWSTTEDSEGLRR